MNKKSITTKRQFELFQEYVEKWIDYFGLKGWHIEFGHVTNKDARASIAWRLTGRIAFVQLSKEWENRDTFISDSEIERSAFHEVCELFLGRLEMMASGKTQNNRDCVEEEVHAIIRTLENVLFEKYKESNKVIF
jgi:hypothetical protein